MKNTDCKFQLYSKETEYDYTIQVYTPEVEPPKSGFSIIYVLDGQSYFEIVKYAVKLQSPNTPKTKVQASIVVGVCHKDQDMRKRRFFEFTAPASKYVFPDHAKGKQMDLERYGGATLFKKFMEEELKPLIETRFPVNKREQTLYGHSLAGYYTIWCYLTHCANFQTYVAISPSIWWNGKELHQYLEQANSAQLQRIFMAVGEHEGFMVENAKEFFLELPTYPKELYIALEENHASVVPATISRALRF